MVWKACFHWQPHFIQSKFHNWGGKHVSTGNHILYKASFTIGLESMFPLATTFFKESKFYNWWGKHVSTGNHILFKVSFTIGEESTFPLATTSYTKHVLQLVWKACFHWQPHFIQSKFHNWGGKHVSTGNHILYKASFTIGLESMFPLATTFFKESKFYNWWGKHVSTGNHILFKVSFTIGEESTFPLATTSYTKQVLQLVWKACFHWQPHFIQS